MRTEIKTLWFCFTKDCANFRLLNVILHEHDEVALINASITLAN